MSVILVSFKSWYRMSGMSSKKEVSVLSEEKVLLEEWEKRLRETGVPLEEWGKGEAKTLNHLVKEISREAVTVFFDEKKGIWIREVKDVEVKVLYESFDGTTYFLREDRQVFKDGRVRRRGHSWVAEKAEKDESGLTVVERAIKEELDLLSPFASGPEYIQKKKVERDSNNFPGIISKHSVSCFEVRLTPEQFNPEGYIEEQEDKTTFFVWEEK